MSSLLCAVEEFSTLSRGFRENVNLRKHYVKQEARLRLRLIVANLVFVSCIVVFLGLLETSSDLFRAMTMSACCAFAAFMFHSNTCALNNKKEDCVSSKEPEGKRKKGASCGCATNFMLMMDLRKKIMAFRDIIDLPLCSNYATIDELVIRTIRDLHNSFPEDITTTIQTSEMKGASTDEVMVSFYEALSSLQKSWMSNYKRTEILKNDMEDLNSEQIVEAVLTIIDHMIKEAIERFDMMYDDNQRMFQSPRAYNTFGKNFMDPYSEMNSPVLGSPVTPTSVLDFMEVGDNARSKSRASIVSSSASIPLPLRVRGIKKLSPVDVRCLSFNMMSHVGSKSRSPVEQMIRKYEDSDPKDMPESTKEVTHVEISRDCNKERLEEIKDNEFENENEKDKDKEVVTKELPETEVQLYVVPNLSQSSSDLLTASPQNVEETSLPPPLTLQPIVVSIVPQPSSSPSPPPPPPKSTQPSLKSNIAPPPPPPPPSTIKNYNALTTAPPSLKSKCPPPPPPPIKSGSGPPAPNSLAVGGSPPPPPPGAGRSLRAKKASSKLKRSTQLGNLYRILKGKIEGPSLKSKSFNGRKGIGSSPAGAKQGMADALAEMTKRSSYFQQIEEDVQNYAQTINELKMKIKAFQTSDMKELIRFHKQVESHLEKLTDETQVLARFEGFPSKKLEALRTAAFLYLKLDVVYNDLKSWKIEPPLRQLLDKVECYFTKVKKELDAFERTKDEEAKKFRSHNITFDFQILTRIKESMVDVSSSCMELALKERREAKDVEAGDKPKQGCPKMLWRAFQFAFRVYTFAGGLDDRADELTKELAQEIERAPQN